MKLIICEKQAAAKRIALILGGSKIKSYKKNGVSYYEFDNHLVVGLSGHVLKVDFPKGYESWSKVDLKKLINSKINYVPDKKAIISVLKFLSKKCDEFIIATDFDTEGESIGLEAAKIINKKVKRMRFSALTKTEVLRAYENLVDLDVNLAESANARREIDLIWGAVLTRFLSVSTKRLGRNYLSAGRVQSPTLSLIVDKEIERLNFKPKTYWEAIIDFGSFNASSRFNEKPLINNKFGVVKDVKVNERVVNPPHPFNTTSYLTAAASLGFSGINAMRIAESLYLKGLISYPRTDNTVYPKSINLRKIVNDLGRSEFKKFLKKDLIPTRGKKESKDHPPIHPTGIKPTDLTANESKIYELIVKRFLATLSKDSVEQTKKVIISVGNDEFIANGYKIIDKGWRGVYDYSLKKEILIPDLMINDKLKIDSITINEKLTQPPNRYGHGTIIKLMSNLNLGTKSTRPAIIQKLIDRYYVFYSKSLEPTPIAISVINALKKYAPLIVSPEMTSNLEKSMELIASGVESKESVVNKSRKLLIKALDSLESNKELISSSIRKGINDSKIIGKCSKCGNDMLIIYSRNRFIGCKGYPDCKNSFPLPAKGIIQVTNNVCSDCGLKKIALINKKVFVFCPNIDCPSKDNDPIALELRKKRSELFGY